VEEGVSGFPIESVMKIAQLPVAAVVTLLLGDLLFGLNVGYPELVLGTLYWWGAGAFSFCNSSPTNRLRGLPW